MPSALRSHWSLDPAITFLNHGSFGACPIPVLAAQQRERDRLEQEPVRYIARELESKLDAARAALGKLVGADPQDLALVTNATTGVNTVVRSLPFSAGDELLALDHGYNACINVLRHVAAQTGAKVVLAPLPFPGITEDAVVEAVLEKVTPRTRLAMLDHVTSPTGLVLPIARLVRELEGRGVPVLVDGAHAPGMVPLDLDALGASYYTGNCHKWLCAPKGVAFLHVRRALQKQIRPLVISHGANSTRSDRSRFLIEFAGVGTLDATGFVVLPEAIAFLEGLIPGGLPALMARNRALVLEARALLAQTLSVALPCPESMIGSLAMLPLPEPRHALSPSTAPLFIDPLQQALMDRFGIEVPVWPFPAWPSRILRISAQAYNAMDDYRRLGEALTALA
jgi:isopenicillin-N epimerase